MRSLTLTGAAMLMATLLTGCSAEAGPTAENASGLLADATSLSVSLTFTEPIVPAIKSGKLPRVSGGFLRNG
jgi:hypothetical protein